MTATGAMMIRKAHGNLLADDAEALVNTVNTVGVMGKGIALQFKRAYPDMFREYARLAKAGQLQLGRMHVWATGAMSGPRYVINFPTKQHWRSPSRLADIEAGLVDLVQVVDELGITSIAIPPLGCGNGGLDWSDVAPRIWKVFAPLAGTVDVRVYPPEGAPPAAEMVNRTTRPRLTASRAGLLAIIAAYRAMTWEWPSMLETQKLAYFFEQAGEPLRLDFAKGHYGPYADNLRKALREMEGHFISGFGDGSAGATDASPVEVTASLADVRQSLANDAATGARVTDVLTLIDGFDSAYGLELLASVHWAAGREGADTPEAAADAVRVWNRRKAGMFDSHHINVAWGALDDRGWLPTAVPTCAGSRQSQSREL